jgi:hypothetical protein
MTCPFCLQEHDTGLTLCPDCELIADRIRQRRNGGGHERLDDPGTAIIIVGVVDETL